MPVWFFSSGPLDDSADEVEIPPLLALAPTNVALILHAAAAPLLFIAIAWGYFRLPGSREPLPTALAWTALVAVLDIAVVATLVLDSYEMILSVLGFWLPLALIFLGSWGTGGLISTMPWSERLEGRGAVEVG